MRPDSKNILIVDDEPDFRQVLGDFLRDNGYEILEAEDGLQALEIFKDPNRAMGIDLVITDFRMPRMGGEALIREIRSLHPYLPIIGITGYQELSEQIKVMTAGSLYFLEKPLPPWPIVERIVETTIRLYYAEKELTENRETEDNSTQQNKILTSGNSVFISYNRKDIKTARGLANALQARNVEVWFDEKDILPGDDFQTKLESALRECPVAAILFGADGLGDWQQVEIKIVNDLRVKGRIKLIPVLLPGSDSSRIPLFLQLYNWIDFQSGINNEKQLNALTDAILAPEHSKNSHPCLLIVDDDTRYRRNLSDYLKDHNYAVIEATGGTEALEIFKNRRDQIELVITDLEMKRVRGEVLIGEISRSNPDLPIIGITGHDLRETFKLLRQQAYFFEKTIPLEVLEQFIANLTQSYRVRHDQRKNLQDKHQISLLLSRYTQELVNTSIRSPTDLLNYSNTGLEIATTSFTDYRKDSLSIVDWVVVDNTVLFYMLEASVPDMLSMAKLCVGRMILQDTLRVGGSSLDNLAFALKHQLSGARADLLDTAGSVAVFLGSVDLNTGELDYISSGRMIGVHFRNGSGKGNPLLLTPRSNTLQELDPSLQRNSGIFFKSDLLLLLSTGATDAIGDERDIARLESLLRNQSSSTFGETLRNLRAYLSNRLEQDATVLAVGNQFRRTKS